MPLIEKNVIYFKYHMVICDPACANADYMEVMAESLTPAGSSADHRAELRDMNNDGTWSIKMKCPADRAELRNALAFERIKAARGEVKARAWAESWAYNGLLNDKYRAHILARA